MRDSVLEASLDRAATSVHWTRAHHLWSKRPTCAIPTRIPAAQRRVWRATGGPPAAKVESPWVCSTPMITLVATAPVFAATMDEWPGRRSSLARG